MHPWIRPDEHKHSSTCPKLFSSGAASKDRLAACTGSLHQQRLLWPTSNERHTCSESDLEICSTGGASDGGGTPSASSTRRGTRPVLYTGRVSDVPASASGRQAPAFGLSQPGQAEPCWGPETAFGPAWYSSKPRPSRKAPAFTDVFQGLRRPWRINGLSRVGMGV